MLSDIPESDWRHFKEVHPVLLERYCARTLAELSAEIGAPPGARRMTGICGPTS